MLRGRRAGGGGFVAALAAGSALAAGLASASPTGAAGADLAARAALGAALVLLGARAGPVALLVGATVAVAAALGSPVAAAAVATLVAALVTTLAVRRAPLVTAAGGGALAQVALRLDGDALPSAPAAACILLPVVLLGAARLDGRVRRRVLAAAAVVGGLAAAAAALGVLAALLARPSLDRAVAAAGDGLAAARRADTAPAAERLEVATRSFADAAATLHRWWARPAGVVPVAAQHLRSLRTVAAAGQRLSALGADALGETDLRRVRITDGAVPLERLRALDRSAGRAARGLTAARRQLDSARSPWLLPALDRRLDVQRARLAEAESSAHRVERVLRRLPDLLGGNGPRRYFLAVVTPAELRGSGGMIGNYGELAAEGGRLRLTRFGRTLDLNAGGDPASRTLVAPDDYVARYGRYDPASLWQNVTLSPDFPTVAGVIAALYPQSGGAPVDGVVSVDPTAIAALLGVVGPVHVPPWPEPLTAENTQRVLLHEQYLRLDHEARVRFLGDVVEQVWGRLSSGTLPAAGDLLGALGPVVPGKHLMLAGTRRPEQRLFDELGVSGRMAPARPDSLAVVTQSAGENKIDWFLRKELDYRVRLDPALGSVKGSLRIVLHNDAPPGGLPAYVIGNPIEKGVPPGHNRMLLSVYTPWHLDGARVGGAPASLEEEYELGRRVYSTFVVVPPKGSLTVELDVSGRLRTTSDYRLHLHRQPAAAPDDVRATLHLDQRRHGSASLPTSVTRHVTLDRNRTLRFAAARRDDNA